MISRESALSSHGSARPASPPVKWRVLAVLLFLTILLTLAWGSLREPAHADAAAASASAGGVAQRPVGEEGVSGSTAAEALASRAVSVLAPVAPPAPAPPPVVPVPAPTTTPSPVQVVTPPPAAPVPPATTLQGLAGDTATLAETSPATPSIPPVTTSLSDPATSPTGSRPGGNPRVTLDEPSPVVGVADRRAPVADLSVTEAAFPIPVVPSGAPADPAPLAARLASPSGSPALTQKFAPAPALLTAATANPPGAVSQCNGTDNVGGQAVACEVTVTNNLNVATGETSSVVEVEECHGAANTVLTCVNSVTPSDELTTSVDQCNGSGSGGGGTVECHVHIVNNITGPAGPTPATINQCNGSGAGGGTLPTVMCDPAGNTTDATISQCNDSGNGGGPTMRVQCTATPSTETSVLPVAVDQCNGSGNGGGATVTCTVSVTNNIITEPPVVIPPVEPPVVIPPLVVPRLTEPPEVVPPVVVPPVVLPPVVVASPVVQPTSTPQPEDDATTPLVSTGTVVPVATPVSTMAVTPVLTTAFTLTTQPVTPTPASPQATATTVQTAAPVTSTTVGPVSVVAASTSAELVPAPTQSSAVRLALTGVDSRWMLLLAALAMALGVLTVRLASPTTIQSPISERTSR